MSWDYWPEGDLDDVMACGHFDARDCDELCEDINDNA